MNQHNDNLEHFFRKGLNEDNNSLFEGSDWDMPSDSVWEGIEESLPPTKRNYSFIPIISIAPARRTKWGAAASILLLCFAYIGYNTQQKIVGLQEEMAIQSDQLKYLQESNNTIAQFPSDRISEENKIATAFSKREVKDLSKEGRTVIYKDNVTETPQPILVSSTIPFLPKDDIALVSNESYPALMQSLELESNKPLIFAKEELLGAKEFNIKPAFVQHKKNHFYAGLFVGPSYWKTKTESKIDDAVLVKGKVAKETGIEKGVKLGWQINDNWSLETGVSLVKNTKTLEHDLNFVFDSGKEELQSDGTLLSSYNAKMNTSFGDFDMAVDLTRSQEELLAEGTPINVGFNNELTTSLIQVPLRARYGVQKGKLNVSCSAGMVLSFLKEQNVEMPEGRIGEHPQLLEERVRLQGQPELNKMQYAVQGGVQLAYSPKTTVEFYIAPSYTKGLTSISESEETSTTLAQAGVMAGVNLRF